MKINNHFYSPFKSAFNDETYASFIAGRRGASPIPHRQNKVTSLEKVVDLINDGDVISYPHYYRAGDKGLQLVIEKLREKRKKDLLLYGNAFFDHTDPWLIEAFRDGTLRGLYGNVYRKFGAYVTAGELLPWVSIGFSHGNRVRNVFWLEK